MQEDVILKGDRDGLLIVVNSEKPFSETKFILENKLKASSDFFVKSKKPLVIRYKGSRNLTLDENEELSKLLEEYGLIYNNEDLSEENKEQQETAKLLKSEPDALTYGSIVRPALTINRTVRGGQEIRFNGSVIVMGDVNPAARILAEHDIIVAGTTRGILHAGVLGDYDSIIMAGNFSGGQIRIADLIVRAPDDSIEVSGPEIAKIQDKEIVITTIRR